jgi:hypothetical protein
MSSAHQRQRTAAEQDARDREHDDAREELKKLEDGDSVPSDPAEWPTGRAKFLTFGNDDDAYGVGATAMLGPADVELHADGPPTIRGAIANPSNGSVKRSATGGRRQNGAVATPARRGRFNFRRRAR